MAKKSMSFGKLLAIFGGFFVLMLVGTVLVMKGANKSAPSVVTKTYAPAENQAAPTPAPAPEQHNPQIAEAMKAQEAAQAQAQAQSQAALQRPQSAPQSPDVSPAASAAASPANAAPAVVTLAASSQQDIAQRLVSIDSQLASIQTRLATVEGKRQAGSGAANGSPVVSRAKPVRRVQTSYKPSKPSIQPGEEMRPASKSSEVKALAVVGNRAWVRGADGLEESITTGDTMPVPRPRVRSMDASTGVVIMSSDAE